jgi:hypothetical protein
MQHVELVLVLSLVAVLGKMDAIPQIHRNSGRLSAAYRRSTFGFRSTTARHDTGGSGRSS